MHETCLFVFETTPLSFKLPSQVRGTARHPCQSCIYSTTTSSSSQIISTTLSQPNRTTNQPTDQTKTHYQFKHHLHTKMCNKSNSPSNGPVLSRDRFSGQPRCRRCGMPCVWFFYSPDQTWWCPYCKRFLY